MKSSEITLAAMVERCRVVPSGTPCSEIDEAFGGEWDGSSVLVTDRDGAVGLLGRASFLSKMAGRFGYGRSLWGRQPVGAVATWGVALVHPTTTIVQAAALIVDSVEGYRDLPVVDDDGKPLGIVRPVVLMRALADQTALRAATDQLTGVASRARFMEELALRVAALEAKPGAVIVAFLDLDRLKPVNDLFGHTLGDALLRSVAGRLAGAIKPKDLLGRLGGDEFAVVTTVKPMSEQDLQEKSLAFGEKLRLALTHRDKALPKRAESRASIGVAFTSVALEDSEPLLTAADEAMYAAKVAGGDRVRLGGLTTVHGRSVPTEDLSLIYQPVIDVRTGHVTAVEALLRVRGDNGLLSFPAERMQQAVRAGSTLALDLWVLSRACTDMARWDADSVNTPRRVNVNLAPQSVCEAEFARELLGVIDASGLARDRVCIELSEHAGFDDLVRATPQLVTLTEAGVGLALDDMGATFGALRLLGSVLPIDCVKVDRSIIEGCGLGLAFDGEMLVLVSRLAERFAIDVVAEGVETGQEDEAVRRNGIHQIQGFLHSVPLVESDLLAFLADRPVTSEKVLR
ncbi:MAG: EAL domain-containing protein [Demequinaceae bacterium]|nr:EAL domain-containing protein [Demequinaceae bacterium]